MSGTTKCLKKMLGRTGKKSNWKTNDAFNKYPAEVGSSAGLGSYYSDYEDGYYGEEYIGGT